MSGLANAQGFPNLPIGGSLPSILIIPNGAGGSKAIPQAGITIAGITSGDSATVFQNAINVLAVHNGGSGGMIAFRGQHVWSSPVTLYPGISLVGQGPLANKSVQNTGATIQSTYNGATLILTAVGASEEYFPYLSNFSMFGDNTKASQVLVQADASGGASLLDAFLDHVTLFNGGLYNLYINTSGKYWCDNCYFEGGAGDNIRAGSTGSPTLAVTNSYIFGATNNGIYVPAAVTNLTLIGNRIWNNAQSNVGAYGLYVVQADTMSVVGNIFRDNGAAANYACRYHLLKRFAQTGNVWEDDRGGGSNVNRFIEILGFASKGSIVGDTFDGSTSTPIFLDDVAGMAVTIANCPGMNDAVGSLSTPIAPVGTGIGLSGTSATIAASTAYRNTGTPLFLNVTGGTGVSITIKDSKGNTVTSGLTTYTGPLPVGYTINFGAFSVAPTVYCGVA